MAQVLNLALLQPNSALTRPDSPPSSLSSPSRTRPRDLRQWTLLQQSLKCNGRFSCLFSDNRREEQARKALESALGGKKIEFEKWNKEIKRREEVGGGGDAGGGGWFGWGRRFGWSNGDNFWQEAKQISLAVLVSLNCKRRSHACYGLESAAVCVARNEKCVNFCYHKDLETIPKWSC